MLLTTEKKRNGNEDSLLSNLNKTDYLEDSINIEHRCTTRPSQTSQLHERSVSTKVSQNFTIPPATATNISRPPTYEHTDNDTGIDCLSQLTLSKILEIPEGKRFRKNTTVFSGEKFSR